MKPGVDKKSHDELDRLTSDWYLDLFVRGLVFFGGISGIIFIIAIFVFITTEGIGFIADRFTFAEFLVRHYGVQPLRRTQPTVQWPSSLVQRV